MFSLNIEVVAAKPKKRSSEEVKGHFRQESNLPLVNFQLNISYFNSYIFLHTQITGEVWKYTGRLYNKKMFAKKKNFPDQADQAGR